jgi:hypothetical protein
MLAACSHPPPPPHHHQQTITTATITTTKPANYMKYLDGLQPQLLERPSLTHNRTNSPTFFLCQPNLGIIVMPEHHGHYYAL